VDRLVLEAQLDCPDSPCEHLGEVERTSRIRLPDGSADCGHRERMTLRSVGEEAVVRSAAPHRNHCSDHPLKQRQNPPVHLLRTRRLMQTAALRSARAHLAGERAERLQTFRRAPALELCVPGDSAKCTSLDPDDIASGNREVLDRRTRGKASG
jgi:hypothetical protein